MSSFESALRLIKRGFEEQYAAYDEDGCRYYTCTPKQRRAYQKIVTNLENLIGKVYL